jgi:hypothetical protein
MKIIKQSRKITITRWEETEMAKLYKDLAFRLLKIKLLAWLCCPLNPRITSRRMYLVFSIILKASLKINDYLKMMINNLLIILTKFIINLILKS